MSRPAKIAFRLLLALIVSTLLAGGGFLAAYNGLEHRDRTLATQEVAEYVRNSSDRVQQLLAEPSISQLDVTVLPDDDTRVRIRGEVGDLPTYRRVREAFNDVHLERFEPAWEITIQKAADRERVRDIFIPSIGVTRAYSVRATLAAGVAGFLFTVTFSVLAYVLLRERAVSKTV